MMNCQNCGQELNPDFFPLGLAYCPQCGSKIETSDHAEGINFCPYCGRRLMAQTKYCPECGKMLLTGNGPYQLTGVQNVDISECNAELDAPVISTQDPAEITGRHTLHSLFDQIWEVFDRKLVRPISDILSGRRNLKRLYQDWAAHDALPQAEIPDDEYFKNIRKTPAGVSSVPIWMVLLLVAGVILIFIGAGFLIAAQLNA